MENNFCDNFSPGWRSCRPVLAAGAKQPIFSGSEELAPVFDFMNLMLVVLRLIHILAGVYWAGTLFFFVTFVEPSLRSMGPDGGKVMIRFFERGYLKLIPIVAILTIVSGVWLLWQLSAGFDTAYMGSPLGMALSTGGLLAIVAFIVGMAVTRPAAARIWELSGQVPQATSEEVRNSLMAEIGKNRARTVFSARIVFVLLVIAVALMAIARFIG